MKYRKSRMLFSILELAIVSFLLWSLPDYIKFQKELCSSFPKHIEFVFAHANYLFILVLPPIFVLMMLMYEVKAELSNNLWTLSFGLLFFVFVSLSILLVILFDSVFDCGWVLMNGSEIM